MLLTVLGGSLGTGSAMQKTSSTQTMSSPLDDLSVTPRHDGLDDSPFRRKQEATRLKTFNEERQRTMTREATELLHLAGELQMKAQKSESEVSREEMVRQVETIEKLAHNVKERMKGAR
jgi:type VI protein secretion system component VasF